MTKHLIKGIVRSGVIHEDGAPQLIHEWLHELLEKAEGTSVTITVEFGDRVGTAKWKCPGCGLKFDAKEPRASIPVSVVRCPKCGDIAEQEGMRSEDEIRMELEMWERVISTGEVAYKAKTVAEALIKREALRWVLREGENDADRN